MELVLNLAWVVCSIGLILLWIKHSGKLAERYGISRSSQALALAMVVLLLLPVISLSDDLMAMQGTAETDSAVRRAVNASEAHTLVAQIPVSLPEGLVAGLVLQARAFSPSRSTGFAPALPLLTRSLDRRPPPQA